VECLLDPSEAAEEIWLRGFATPENQDVLLLSDNEHISLLTAWMESLLDPSEAAEDIWLRGFATPETQDVLLLSDNEHISLMTPWMESLFNPSEAALETRLCGFVVSESGCPTTVSRDNEPHPDCTVEGSSVFVLLRHSL